MNLVSAERKATNLLGKYFIDDPTNIDLETLISAEGGFVIEKQMKGAEGRIIIKNEKAIITVNSKIKKNNKKRFVLAHELGHLLLHQDRTEPFYNDDVESFVDWQGKRPEETEANKFAASLLMPCSLFSEECKGRKFSVNLIKDLANRFQTSLTSTAIRFPECGNYPVVIIFTKDETIRWAKFSSDFPSMDTPLSWIPFNTPVPEGSVAHDIFNGSEVPDEPYEVPASEWFWDDKNLSFYESWSFKEECIFFKGFNAILSFVYTY